MRRALRLAKRGAGRVSPNPLVGCVIVRGGKIMAEGWHKKFGGDHAEIVALKKLGMRARGATLYVTLEPCFHFGKTPPCVDAVSAAGVGRVVIAMLDPNPKTAGKSWRRLRLSGIKVNVGVCGDAARELNRFFIKSISTGLPYVICKVAQSLDGKISTRRGAQGWLTGDVARQYVQDLRARVDAVLVGRQTVEIDNPRLNVRDHRKPQPKRIILDSKLRLLRDTKHQKLFHVHGGSLMIACTLAQSHPRVRSARAGGFDVICLPAIKRQKRVVGVPLKRLLRILCRRGVASVLCEGGGAIFRSFLKQKLADEWQFILAPCVVGHSGMSGLSRRIFPALDVKSVQPLGRDFLLMAQDPN